LLDDINIICNISYIIHFFRFKVHIQVIDSTGLTTFVWFDGVASDQVLGRSVHDLLGGVNQLSNCNFVALH
jgi:hypothetical protein